MGVGGAVDIRPGSMNGGMYHERRHVQKAEWPRLLEHLAFVRDEQQIFRLDQREVHSLSYHEHSANGGCTHRALTNGLTQKQSVLMGSCVPPVRGRNEI